MSLEITRTAYETILTDGTTTRIVTAAFCGGWDCCDENRVRISHHNYRAAATKAAERLFLEG